jgi:3',5'-cyclic AMP phosphodiesterase CpdA
MSAVLAASMVISLIIVALPGPATPEPTPLPLPTSTLPLFPTATPSPVLTVSPLPGASATPTAAAPSSTATEEIIGPELPTATPEITATLTPTPTVTITPTTSSAAPPLIFAVAGDSRDGPDVYRRVLASVLEDGSQFLLHTGDLVNQGTEALWQGFQETMTGFNLPFYPVPGNHDSLDGELQGYLAYSGAPAAHYSFDAGPAHFTLADSHNGGIGAAELGWLQDDLSATVQPVKLVFLHHPPFDPDGTDHIMAYGNEGFMALMVEQRVDAVFAGHIHAYVQGERDGVTYYVTGGAGAPVYTTGHPQAFHHYLRVTVQQQEITVQVVQV